MSKIESLVTGTLTKDAELKRGSSGKEYVALVVKITTNGEKPLFCRANLFGDDCESVAKLKKGDAVGYRVYPKRGSTKGGYWQYGTVEDTASSSHARIKLADGTTESVGGSRLHKLESTGEADLSTIVDKEAEKEPPQLPAKGQPGTTMEQSAFDDAALKALDAILGAESPVPETKPKATGRKAPTKAASGQFVLPGMPGMAAEIDRQDFVRKHRDQALDRLWGWSDKPEDAQEIQGAIDAIATDAGNVMNAIYSDKGIKNKDDVFASKEYQAFDAAVAAIDNYPIPGEVILDHIDNVVAKALDTRPKPRTLKKPRKSDKTLAEAKSDMQAAHDAAAKLMEKIRSKLMSGVDPELMAETVQVAYLYTKAGIKTFKGYVEAIVENFGDAFAREFAPYMESGWRALNTRGIVNDEAGKVADVLMEETDVDTTRDDNPEAMGDEPTKPRRKPKKDRETGKAPGSDQPADTSGRGDDEGAGSGPTEDSGGNRDGISSPAGSLNNHQIAERPDWLEGGPVTKLNRNIDAITTMNRVEAEGRRATPGEQAIIAGYTGWGHLKQFFIRDSDLRAIKAIQGDKWNLNAFKTLDARVEEQIRDNGRRKGSTSEQIETKIQREKANNKHRIRLATSMTPAEYAQARKSTRYSHYTDPAIARAMWGFLRDTMPEAGKIRVLEPSEGSGMFWGTMPDSMFKRAEMHGIDMDPSSSRIAKHLYPSVRHLNVPFQQSPYPEGFFDLAITNVPFNKNPVQDPSAEFSDELSLHNYFFAKTASRLREGGVVAFITTHFTMDAANAKQRSVITNQGLKFLGAVRLNQDAFGNVANTKVTTDIIVMQKVAPGTLTTNNTFELAATTMAAPHGEEVAEITVHPYFQSKPGMVAGQITANGEMRGAAPELTVESDMTPEETAEFISRMLGKIEIDKQAFIEGQQQRNDMAEVSQGATTFVPEHLQGLGVGKMAVDGSNLVVRTSAETMLVVKTEFSPTLKARAEKWFAIRDALTNLQQLQTSPDNPEAAIEAARKELNRVYDDFVGEFNEKKNDYSGYKPLNTTYNRSMFAADYMSATVQALENTKLIPTGELDKNGKEKTRLRVEKASIFTERTEWPLELRPKPQTVKEALAHSMFTNGGVDIDWIATTLGKSKVEVAKQLEKYAFEVPNDGGWEINEVYLSGNIAKKLEVAEEAASKNPVFTRNVDALREVLPVPKTFEQLVVYPNSPFLPADLLREFVSDALGLGSFDLYRNDQELGGGWRANYDKSNEVNQTTQDLEQYAVRDGSRIRKRGFELFLDMIAGKPTIILDRDAHDRTSVNERLTNLAKSKRLDLSRAFDTFIRSAQERMDAVANEFNRLLSGYVKPLIPEWVVSFDGMSSNWKDLIRPYQKEAAAKVAMGGNTLLAHRVGYGKTLSGVAGIMEQRRLGVARKPLAVVPNHLTGQWAKAFADFYPSAKVMAPTSKDFEKQNRQATMNRIMTGNWDAVIIPESSFKKLPMSSEYVEQFFQEQIAQSIDAAERARAEEGGDPRTIAELEDVTERLRNQLAKYLAEAQKDPGPFFDEMGIDSLTVDEAHHYKNLPFYTQNTRVAGINPTGSQQAFDMLMKTDFINALTGSRNVTFLTGTPIANSMTEAWVMMRYLMPEAMKEANVFAFDDWKNAFGEVVDRTRVNTIGTGFRTESRFQQFVNLDVLAKMFQQVADIQMINNDVQVPPVQGGKPRSIVVPASDAMKNFMLGLAARSANMPQDPSEDNMLNVMTVGAGAAIDFRLLDAAAMPSETSKITVAADEVARIFQETSPFKGTQIVWADRGVPKAAKKLTSEMQQLGAWMLEEVQSRPLTMEDVKAKWKEMRPTKNSSAELQRFMAMTLQDMNYTTGTEDDEVSYKVDMKDEPTVWVNEITDVDPNITEQAAPPWNVYQQMKDELVARGVPANQIVFIHDFKTAAQKVQLWEKMNNGDLRVLLGNTPRLGTGANIQQRLVAAHHLDAPWRPADVEQRDGRIIRSGNRVITIGDKIGYAEETGVDLDGVIINRYVTEGSIDARYWDTNEMKAQMLQDFWSGNPGVSIEELGATTLSMSDVKAAAVANPLLKRKIELEHEVNKLSEEYRGAVQSKTQSDSRLREAQQEVPEAKKKLEAAKKRVAWWEAGKAGLPEGENFGVEIDGEVLFRRDDIGEAIDRKLHEIGRNIPLAEVKKDGSDWAKQSLSKSSDELELGKIFGKKITVSVEGGFRNPETGEVVGGNTWQEKQLAKQLKDGSWERSYSNALVRVAGVDGLARLGSNPQGFAARLRNFSDPGENWIEGHEKALASKEKALKELENLVKSIPEPDSSKLVAKQQELEEVANEIGDEDDDQITYWVATEELERTLGPDTLHEQLGRVDSVEVLLGYINHPKDGKLSVFNRAGDTRPPAHAMVWVEGENAIVGYVPRDDEGVMGLPILKPRKLIGVIQHPEHGELMVFDHKEGELTQQGKVWVEKEDGSQEFGYQDKALNVVMGVEMLKTESFGGWPEDVKRHTEQSKKPRKPTGQSDASTSTNSASSDPQQPRLDAFTSPELQDARAIVGMPGTVRDTGNQAEADFGKDVGKGLGITGSVPLAGPHRGMGMSVRHFFQRFFTSQGELPSDVYDAKVRKEGRVAKEMNRLRNRATDLRRGIKKALNGKQLTQADIERMNAVLRGEKPLSTVPVAVRAPLKAMRDHIDSLSSHLILEGVAQGDLVGLIAENMGVYATRSYRVFDNPKWRDQVPDAVRNHAVAAIRALNPDKSDAEVVGILESLLFRGAADSPVALLKGSKLGSKDLSTFIARKDIPEWLRELWGEYKDAGVNYARSVFKMAHLLANQQFLNEVRDAGLGKWLRTDEEGPIINEYGEVITPIAAASSSVMEPLNGLLTTPEIKKAFERFDAPGAMPEWLRVMMTVNYAVKYSKTVGSVMTHVRNAVSNVGFAVANGHWRLDKAGKAVWGTATGTFQLSDAKFREYYNHLAELGIVGEDVRAGELKDALRDASEADIDEFLYNREARHAKKAVAAGRAGVRFINSLYQAEDGVWKIYAWENEKARYAKAHPEWSQQQVEEHAAKIVRNTYPTYSKIPEAIRTLRRFPLVGTFVSFPSEVVRTTFHTVALGIEEMQSKETRSIGAQRLAGTVVSIGMLSVLSRSMMAMFGIGDDDDEDLRWFVPPWQENSRFVYLNKPQDATFHFVDLGYSDPHAYLTDSVVAFMRGDDWKESIGKAAAEFMRPFASEEILAKALMDLRSNEGDKIYNPKDEIGEQAKDIVAHLWTNALEPGTLSSVRRVITAIGGTDPSKSVLDEVLAVTTGQRIQKVDVAHSLGFRVRDFGKAITQIQGIARKTVTSRGTANGVMVAADLARMEKLRLAAFSEMQQIAGAARRLGVSEESIRTMLIAELPDDVAEQLMTGDYSAYEMTPQTVRQMMSAKPDEFMQRFSAWHGQRTPEAIRSYVGQRLANSEPDEIKSELNMLGVTLDEAKLSLREYWQKRGWPVRNKGALVDALRNRFRKLNALYAQ